MLLHVSLYVYAFKQMEAGNMVVSTMQHLMVCKAHFEASIATILASSLRHVEANSDFSANASKPGAVTLQSCCL